MLGLIVTAHGKYASGCVSGYELITGGSDNVIGLDFDGSDVKQYSKDLSNLITAMIKKYGHVVIATDIAGGTPYNTAVKLSYDNSNISVLSGANFHMIYELAISEDDLEKSTTTAMQCAKDGISRYSYKNEDDDRSFYGGI